MLDWGNAVRLTVHLEPEQTGLLPTTYREYVQAAIYRLLPARIGQPLHDGSYWSSTRPLKFFVFSQLYGAVQYRKGEGVMISGPIWFRFASPDRNLALGVAAGLLQFGRLRLGALDFAVREVATQALPELGETLVVQTLSPITVYRTVDQGGKRRTEYFNPLEEEFAELVVSNLMRKARVLGWWPDDNGTADQTVTAEHPVRIRLLGGISARQKRLECYKGTWIEGWVGRFKLEGPPQLLQLALEAGLGAKNSQGFGYVEEVLAGVPPRRPHPPIEQREERCS